MDLRTLWASCRFIFALELDSSGCSIGSDMHFAPSFGRTECGDACDDAPVHASELQKAS